jgi:exportin-2 (importin alpha re-exporter)
MESALSRSLSPNPAERRAAERDLDVLKASPGFSQLALQLAQSSETSGPIRQAAALLFKNYVRAGWAIVRVCPRWVFKGRH